MQKGRVRNLPEGKNFGFIQCESDKDYFFHRDDFNGHWNDLLSDFRRGQVIMVEFEPAESVKGLRASQVKILSR
jgi:cold shock CspA family protein